MCHPIGFVFFWMHQKSKNTTLVSSYWICFLGSPIGFAFLEAPKKQKHNPCALLLDLFFLKAPKKQKTQPLCPPIGFAFWALLLDLLFWKPQKSKNTTLVPSYWICFFWKHQKSKNTTLVPFYWICFFGSPQKAKTQPLCPPIGFAFLAAPKKQKQNPCALLLHLLFLEAPKRKKKLVPSYWMCFFESHKKEKAQPLCKAQTQPLCSRVGFAFLAA